MGRLAYWSWRRLTAKQVPCDIQFSLNCEGYPAGCLSYPGNYGTREVPSVFNIKVPTCTTGPAQAPHTIRNNSTIPLHYYRIEFKRVDGDDFQSHWREWYPWMKYMNNIR
jgi:hypothetical protein